MNHLRRKAETNKILSSLKEPYRSFFSIHNRIKSKRSVAVINPECYEDFLLALSKDQSIPTDIKILFFLIISAGLRVSEALHLQRQAFEKEGENLFFFSKVLKKREFIERKSIVHPAIQSEVLSYVFRFRPFDKLFTLDRHQALYQIKKIFGEALDLHALRHSHISYLIFEKGLSAAEVEGLVKINRNTVELYAHKDQTDTLRNLYGQRPKPRKFEAA